MCLFYFIFAHHLLSAWWSICLSYFVLKSLNISLDLECKKVWRYQSKIRSNMNWYIMCVTFYSDDSVCFSLLFNSLFCTIACTKHSIYRLKRRTAITSIGLTLPNVCVCPKHAPGFITSYVVVFFYSIIGGKKCLFVLLILMELLTITV
jgi:hypothetical protein